METTKFNFKIIETIFGYNDQCLKRLKIPTEVTCLLFNYKSKNKYSY